MPLLHFAASAVAAAAPCNMSQHSWEICDDFCNGRCGFYNASRGDTGAPMNVSMYRITPKNVTGIRNKNTGDAPGDANYFLSKKGNVQACARDPTTADCLSLDPEDLYGEFTVEIDGQFGPYLMCNPVAVGHKPGTQYDPLWSDTRDFECGMNCMHPSYDGCGSSQEYNGSHNGGMRCYCDGTHRETKTVGRESRALNQDYEPRPDRWAPQCQDNYDSPSPKRNFAPVTNWSIGMQIWVRSSSSNHQHQSTVTELYAKMDGDKCSEVEAIAFRYNGYSSGDRIFTDSERLLGVQVGDVVPQCYNGTVLEEVTGWSVASMTAMACERCSANRPHCTGWASVDNRTARLFTGDLHAVDGECQSAHYYTNQWSGGSWFGVTDIGGWWYSTPVAGECAPGQPLGTDGCTWRVVETVTYKQAQCIDDGVDAAVERYHASCFSACGEPLNRTSDCYIGCYRAALTGDAAVNLTRMDADDIVSPWKRGFESDDPSSGGCPRREPAVCEGKQCPLPLPTPPAPPAPTPPTPPTPRQCAPCPYTPGAQCCAAGQTCYNSPGQPTCCDCGAANCECPA